MARAWGGACQPRSSRSEHRLSKWRISRSYITFIDTIINISYTLISLSSLSRSRPRISLPFTHTSHFGLLAHRTTSAESRRLTHGTKETERERARATPSTTLHVGWMERRAPQIEADRGTVRRAQGKALHAPLFCARMERRDLTASAPRSPRGCEVVRQAATHTASWGRSDRRRRRR